KANSSVAAGRLNQHGFPRSNFAGALRFIDHAHADAVLHAGAGIPAFQLSQNFGLASIRNPVEPHQRRVPDELRNIVCDFHTKPSPDGARAPSPRSFAKITITAAFHSLAGIILRRVLSRGEPRS